jgi:hypothetical protein
MLDHECPKCLSSSVNDSRQRYYELPLSLVCLKPYRCGQCDHRFWRVSDRQSRKVFPVILYTLGLVLCIGVLWATVAFFENKR